MGTFFAVVGETPVGDALPSQTNSYAFDQFLPEYQKQEIERLKRKTDILAAVDQAAWQQAGLAQGHRVLDLGCGTGSVTQRLSEATYPSDVIGADISEQMIQKATVDYATQHLIFEQADAYQLSFPNDCFDIVHARFLFQHLEYPLRALREINRVLKPGGKLCVIDVDDHWFTLYPEPDSTKPFRQQILTLQQQKGGDPFVGRKLFSYLRCAGFEQVRTRIQIIGTDDCGTEAIIGLLSFGAPYFKSHPQFVKTAKKAQHDIKQTMSETEMWVSVGLFISTGSKPNGV